MIVSPCSQQPANSHYYLHCVQKKKKPLQKKVYETRITALELSTTPLTNGFRNDDIALPYSYSGPWNGLSI